MHYSSYTSLIAAPMFLLTVAVVSGLRSARQLGARPWRIVYRGRLRERGPYGSKPGGLAKRMYLDIGSTRVKAYLESVALDNALSDAERNGGETSIALGWFLPWRWVLAVKSGPHVEREGLFLFVFVGLFGQIFLGILLAFIIALTLHVFASAFGVTQQAGDVAFDTVIIIVVAQTLTNLWAWAGFRL